MDRWTDGRAIAYTRYSIYAVARNCKNRFIASKSLQRCPDSQARLKGKGRREGWERGGGGMGGEVSLLVCFLCLARGVVWGHFCK